MIAPPACDEVLGVQRLVVAGRERVRHEDRRLAGRRDLPDGRAPARASTRSHGRDTPRRTARSRRPAGSRRAAPGSARARSRARPEMCRIAGPLGAPRLDHDLVERPWRPRARRTTTEHRARPAAARRSRVPRSCGTARERAGNRPADDAVLRAVAARERVREEDALRERRAPAGSRARGARPPPSAPPGCRASTAAKTIGPATKPPPPKHDVAAGARAGSRGTRAAPSPRGSSERASSIDGCRGKPLIAEGVELVAGVRNELRFDAIRRPGERHVHAALRQRFRDCERRQHVSCRPPGRDQAPKLSLHCHDERC